MIKCTQNSSSGYSSSLFPQLCQELGGLWSGKDYPQGKALWTLTFDNLKDVGTAIETSGPETLTTPHTRNFQSDILKDHRGSPHIWGKLKSSAPTIRERNSEEKKATQGAEEKYEEKESLSNLWKENTFRFLYSRNKNRILFFFPSMERYHNRTELLKDKVIVTKIFKGSVEDLWNKKWVYFLESVKAEESDMEGKRQTYLK